MIVETKNSLLEKNKKLLFEKYPIFSFFSVILNNAKMKRVCQAKIEAEVNAWHQSLKIGELDVICIYGIALGLPYKLLKSWLKKKKERVLIFVEDDPAQIRGFLEKKWANSLIGDLQVNLFFLYNKELFIDEATIYFLSKKIEITAPLKEKQNRAFFSWKEKLYTRAVNFWYYYVDRLNCSVHFRNFINNVKKFPSSFFLANLPKTFKNRPAIVCGAGASLDAIKPYMKNLEKKALIIAGGSAITSLAEANILPHLGVLIDPNNDEVKRMIKSKSQEIPILYSTRVNSEVFSTFNGFYGYINAELSRENDKYLAEFLDLPFELDERIVNNALTVTSIAIAIAIYLGCDPIILAGVDLAYTKNQLYAEGINAEDEKKRISDNPVAVKDINGNDISTSVAWKNEGENISNFAKSYRKEIINLSASGQKFENIKQKSIEDIFAMFSKIKQIDARQKLHQEIVKNNGFVSEERIQNLLKNLKASFERCLQCTEAILKNPDSNMKIVHEMDLREEAGYKYFLKDYLGIAYLYLKRRGEVEQKERWLYLQNIILDFLGSF